MKRRLFNLAAAVSLLLCVATAGLWIRSCRVHDEVAWAEAGGLYHTLDFGLGPHRMETSCPVPV